MTKQTYPPRIMYIESKGGGLHGSARIGRVPFSRTGATLYYGGKTFRKLGGTGFKANYFDAETGEQVGAKLRFAGAPRFHEFVLQTDEAPATLSARLLENKIVGGVELSRWYPELENCTLWCATELMARETIDKAAGVLADVGVEA